MDKSVEVKEYALPDGRTFMLNEADAKKMGAKPVQRAAKVPAGEIAERNTPKIKKDQKE